MSEEKIVLRVQLVHNGKVVRSFDSDIPEWGNIDPEPDPMSRASIYYIKMQKIMSGRKTLGFEAKGDIDKRHHS